MRVFYTDVYEFPLPEDHRFPLGKYRRLRERLSSDPPLPPDWLHVAPPAAPRELLRAHDPEYVERALYGSLSQREQRRIGLPWSLELAERSLRSVGATLAACRSALEAGRAVYLGGGTHHAHRSFGAGYCVFNDVAAALLTLRESGGIDRAAVLDCDVHQGDGTAAILTRDPELFTMSVHAARNYPFHKQSSDLDIALADGVGDDEYLDSVERATHAALSRSGAQLAVFLAGADPHEGDRLGLMKVSRDGLAERDRIVFDACERRGIPLVVLMAGGYGRDPEQTVAIHESTVRELVRRAGVRVDAREPHGCLTPPRRSAAPRR